MVCFHEYLSYTHRLTERYSSSAVIDYIQTLKRTDYGLAYFYLDYNGRDQQSNRAILGSLVRQLLTYNHINNDDQLHSDIESLYKENMKITPDDLLIKALFPISRKFSKVFLIFDALDECTNIKQRKELLEMLHKMAGNHINVFFTSRYTRDIDDSLHYSPKIEISANDDDINSYINQKIDDNPRACSMISKLQCRDRIVSELTACAKKM